MWELEPVQALITWPKARKRPWRANISSLAWPGVYLISKLRPCLLFFHWFRNPGEAAHRLLWRRRLRMDPPWGGAVHLSAEVAQNQWTYGCPQLELELVVCSSCSNAGTSRQKLCCQTVSLHWTARAQQWAKWLLNLSFPLVDLSHLTGQWEPISNLGTVGSTHCLLWLHLAVIILARLALPCTSSFRLLLVDCSGFLSLSNVVESPFVTAIVLPDHYCLRLCTFDLVHRSAIYIVILRPKNWQTLLLVEFLIPSSSKTQQPNILLNLKIISFHFNLSRID